MMVLNKAIIEIARAAEAMYEAYETAPGSIEYKQRFYELGETIRKKRALTQQGKNMNKNEYPDDPDLECNDCGHCFNKPLFNPQWDGACPECGGEDIHGGGYYG